MCKGAKRVSFYLWIAARDRILITDSLVKRGQSLVNKHCLCCYNGVSVDHLLLHCKFSHTLCCEALEVFEI